MSQVPARYELLDQLPAELPLHERVGGDHRHEPCRLRGAGFRGEGEIEEALGERNGERVQPVAGSEALPVLRVERLVLRRDVGRVADHHVVAAAEDRPQRRGVLGAVDVTQGVVFGIEVLLAGAGRSGTWAVEQGVAGRHVDLERGCVGEPVHAGRTEGGDAQAEAGYRDRERVQVDPRHLIENTTRPLARVGTGLVLRPEGIEALESTEQEVSRAAGGVDQAHVAEAELLDGGIERAVEDELLHELGCLEQRVPLAGALGEVLVEIAEEARVPRRIGEVVREGAGIGVDPLPQAKEATRGVARGGAELLARLFERPDGIVSLVEDAVGDGQRGDRAKDVEQIIAVALCGVRPEVEGVLVERPLAPAAGA